MDYLKTFKNLLSSLAFFALVTLLSSVTTTSVFADEGGGSGGLKRFNITNLNKRAEQRSLKRFTLKEWMEGKEKRQMMDMWLSLNTPSPYEFYISGSLNQFNVKTSTSDEAKKSYEGSFAAYATLVGLTGEYQNNTEEGFNDATAMFNLRLFGDTLQGTHLTVHYGLRTRTENGGLYRLNQQFPAATLQVYLTKFFGLEGNYRWYQSVTDSYFGEINSTDLTTGVFIDFDAFRVFGNYFQEKQNSKLNGLESETSRTGTKIGLRIYF